MEADAFVVEVRDEGVLISVIMEHFLRYGIYRRVRTKLHGAGEAYNESLNTIHRVDDLTA